MNNLGLELLASLEQRFAASKKHAFKGTVRVQISNLSFPWPIRSIDNKILAALQRDFIKNGCLQHETGFSIPAIIDDRSYAILLEKLSIDSQSLQESSLSSPTKYTLPDDIRLECLHGQHRIAAANIYLPPSDRWWLVDLYSQELDPSARQLFREGHSYSTNYSDGTIFTEIRLAQSRSDKVSEERWKSKTTQNKEKDLAKLFKRSQLINALDSILPLRGLWPAFHLGSLDIFLLLRCDEEIARYIDRIRRTWSHILGDQGSLFQDLDEHTVNVLQLRVPAVSNIDHEFVKQQMTTQNLFPSLQDPAIRIGIQQRLLQIDYLIPSIYTLFKDLRYLEPAAKAVKSLIPNTAKGTLRQSLRFTSSLPGTSSEKSLHIQKSELLYRKISGSFDTMFDLAYREIFLCALRYFTSPNNISSKKDMNPVKQKSNATKRYLGFKLVDHAVRMGFSVSIESRKDPSEELLVDMLKNLPMEVFCFQGEIPPLLASTFKTYLSNSTFDTKPNTMPPIKSVGLGVPLSRRCGRACGENINNDDRLHLFLHKVHAPLTAFPQSGNDINSFFVKRSIYIAFFGDISIDLMGASDEDISINGSNSFNSTRSRSNPSMAGNSSETNIEEEPINNLGGATISQGAGDLISCLSSQHLTNYNLSVSFVSDQEGADILKQVPFTKEAVTLQAREYASNGHSLMDETGYYHIFDECYSALVATETRVIIVVNGRKRRRIV